MKPIHIFRFLTLTACIALVYACNKSNTNSPGGNNTGTTADLQTQADDQSAVSAENEAIANDANTVLYGTPAIAGTSAEVVGSGATAVNSTTAVNGLNGPIFGLICDASVVVDTTGGHRTITITYNGSNCWGNRTRTGVVVLTIPGGVHWADPGATVSASIQNLVITRVRDNKTITVNGNKTFTNVSGGLLKNLATLGTITHTVSGNITVTFDNGSQREWSISKQRVFTYNNGIVITTTGTHTDSLGNTNVAEWGVNRNGIGFESQISEPKVFRQDCDFRLVSGQNIVLRTDSVSSQITYGLDANGDPTSCPGTGTYYLKVVVTKANGVILTKILPY